MAKPALCWCIEGCSHLPVVDVQYHDLTATEIEIRESQIEHERTKLTNSKWLINQRSCLENGLTKYPDNTEFTKSASKGRNFNTLFDKYFTGEDWEIHILRTLRLDIFILLCLLFVPTKFDEIYDKGLQDVFAEEVNRYLPTRSPTLVIHQWAAEKAKSRINSAKSEIDSESPEAKQLLQGLNPYLSQTTRRSGKLSRPPTTTLLSIKPPQSTTSETVDTHSIGVDELQRQLPDQEYTQNHHPPAESHSIGVNEPQKQWSNKEYAQNQHSPAESHSIGVNEPQRQWSNKEYAQNQPPPPEPHSLLPPSTSQILPPPSGYGIFSSNTPNTNAQFHRIINGPPTSHLSQRAPAAGYNGGHLQNWSEQPFSQGLHQAPYSAASMPPPSNSTTHRRKSTAADKDGFVNVSQDGFAKKAQKIHKRTGNEESASKKQRVNHLSQDAAWDDSARPMDSASIWDGRSVGDQTGTFGTVQVSVFSEPGQLPLATYSSGNNYSQITNYFPDFTQWADVD